MKTATQPPGGHSFLLSTSAPTRQHCGFALAVMLVQILALAATAPFARLALPHTEIFLPAYAAAAFVVELVTAALFLSLFSVQRSPAILILAAGYLFSGLLVVPWALTFPGVFEGLGTHDGLQSTAAIAALRRLGFPLFVLAYALLKDREPWSGSVRRAMVGSVALVVAVAAAQTWLIFTSADSLPAFMRDARNVDDLWQYIPATALFLYLLGLIVLGVRRHAMLDVWLIVVLCTLVLEIVLISYISGGTRLSVGWWAGRLYGLAATSIVLLVLLSGTTAVYARLARAVAAERRARADRLTAMEALSASIAHEVNQPLASMVTNADAGLRWLEKAEPDLDEARAALKRIVVDGHRASKVVAGIRTLFIKGAQERIALDLNRLLDAAIGTGEAEARAARVAIDADLDRTIPWVIGNPAQLQQVAANLIGNALDAMRSTAGPHLLRITSRRHEPGEVLVSIEDTGTGLDPADQDRIFEPFFTTKPEGMGMGLMFCRSTIEAHGGRLWVLNRTPQGAIFRFSLPAAAMPGPAA